MRNAFSILKLLGATTVVLCMMLGTLGNASATGLLGLAADDACGDSCPCDGDQADEASDSDGGAHLGANTDCEDDCPDCGSVRHALAGLPNAPLVVAYHAQAQVRPVADLPPQSPMLDEPSGVFRPPRRPTRLLAL